jgi:uncharacterized small protein (DUF1192 family)
MFECKICNYSSIRSADIKRHEQTKKHISKMHDKTNTCIDNQTNQKKYICICNKKFKSRQNLWQHKQKCKINNSYNANLNDVLEEHSTDNKLLDKITELDNHINTQSDEIKCLKAQLEKLTKSATPKQSIPKALKRQVWTHWIGREFGIAKCLCCQITDIEKDTFSCGHIIAEKNGRN